MAPEAVSPDSSKTALMLAYLCIKDLINLNDRVDVLDRFGLSDDQISKVCHVAIGSVRNARLQNKRSKTPSKRKGSR